MAAIRSKFLVLSLGLILLLTAAILIVSQTTTTKAPTEKPQEETTSETPTQDLVRVSRVIDGDTIELEDEIRVRYTGIDTPEPENCLGSEASEANKELVQNQGVILEYDIERLDRYGRTLAYVWAGEKFVNEELLRQGLATVTTYPPNVKYVDRFLEAQKEAKDAGRGLWAPGPCPTFSTPSIPPNTSNLSNPPDPSCTIKGNISSSGEKIYHLPGQRYWGKTKIEEAKGERWFCSEEEAQDAGWRKSKI